MILRTLNFALALFGVVWRLCKWDVYYSVSS